MAPVGPVELDEVRLVLGAAAARAHRAAAAAPLRRGLRRAGRGRARARVRRRVRARPRREALPAEDRRGPDPARRAARARSTRGALVDAGRRASRPSASRCGSRSAPRAQRVVLSYPRVDVEQARPRVPSFYGLEALRAAEGRLPGLRRARAGAPSRARAARLGWPAPETRRGRDRRGRVRPRAARAAARRRPDDDASGAAQLPARRQPAPRAARCARAARRWLQRWTPADGLVDPDAARARGARARTSCATRSFSPTALQHFAACPYRFFLQAIHRLAAARGAGGDRGARPAHARRALPRGAVRGAHARCATRACLPVTPASARRARSRSLDEALDARSPHATREQLAPAIPRVWDDGIDGSAPTCASGCAARPRRDDGWVPHRFELSFGLADRDRAHADPASVARPGAASLGGAPAARLDRPRRAPRATARCASPTTRPARRARRDGRRRRRRRRCSSRCSTRSPCEQLLGDAGRGGTALLLHRRRRLRGARRPARRRRAARAPRDGRRRRRRARSREGFLPAAPAKGACRWCDYRPVCGPYEEMRVTARKPARPTLERRCDAAAGGLPMTAPARRPGRRATASATTSTPRSSSRPRRAPARRPRSSAAWSRARWPAARQLDRMVAVTFTEEAAGELKLRLRERDRATRAQDADASAPTRDAPDATRCRSSRRRASAPSTPSAPTSCASGRSRRASTRSSRSRPRTSRGALFDRAFDRWFEAQLAAPGRGRAARSCAARDAATATGPARAAARAPPGSSSSTATSRRRGGATPLRPRREIDALVDELAALARVRPTRGDPDDYFAKSLRRARAASSTRCARREAIARRATTTGSRPSCAACRDARRHWRLDGLRAREPRRSRRTSCCARRDALHAAARGVRRRRRRRPRAAAARRAVAGRRGATRRSRRAPAASTSSTCCCARATWCATTPAVRARAAAALHAPLRRRVPGHRSAPGRDPAAARRRRSRPRPTGARARPVPGQALPRRRSEAVDLPLPARRRRALRGGEAAAASRPAPRSSHLTRQLPRRARDPAGGERGVRAAHARRVAEPGRATCRSRRTAPSAATQPAVVALPVPRPYGDFGKIVDWQIEESLPDAVAAFVDWLVQRERLDGDRARAPERARAGRSRGTSACSSGASARSATTSRGRYVRALEARHLPHVLVGGSSFHEREEVEALRNALAAIEWPDDELAVFATLRGPFFALADERAARLPRARSARCTRSAACPTDAARRRCAEVGEALARAARPAPRPQPPARSPTPSRAARGDARARRRRDLADRRAGARQRRRA